jgi:hypothetical protein
VVPWTPFIKDCNTLFQDQFLDILLTTHSFISSSVRRSSSLPCYFGCISTRPIRQLYAHRISRMHCTLHLDRMIEKGAEGQCWDRFMIFSCTFFSSSYQAIAGLPYSPDAAHLQMSFQSTPYTSLYSNNHHTQSVFTAVQRLFVAPGGVSYGLSRPDHFPTTAPISKDGTDSIEASWPSPQMTASNSHVLQASATGSTTINYDPTFCEPYNVALSYGNPTQKPHGSLASCVEEADCFQQPPIHRPAPLTISRVHTGLIDHPHS